MPKTKKQKQKQDFDALFASRFATPARRVAGDVVESTSRSGMARPPSRPLSTTRSSVVSGSRVTNKDSSASVGVGPAISDAIRRSHHLRDFENYMGKYIYDTDDINAARDMSQVDFYKRTEDAPEKMGTVRSYYYDDWNGTGWEHYVIEGRDMDRHFIVIPETGEAVNVTGHPEFQ